MVFRKSDFNEIRELGGKFVSNGFYEEKVKRGLRNCNYDEISSWHFKHRKGLHKKWSSGQITEDGCKHTALQLKFGLEKQSDKRQLIEEMSCNSKALISKYSRGKMKTREEVSLLLQRLKMIDI